MRSFKQGIVSTFRSSYVKGLLFKAYLIERKMNIIEMFTLFIEELELPYDDKTPL